MKAAIFHPATRMLLRAFPEEVKKEIGKAIYELQIGETLQMPLARPMPSVAAGVYEIRIRDRAGIYRVFYYLKSSRGVLIFHAFRKMTQQTPLHEINLARKRLKEVLNE